MINEITDFLLNFKEEDTEPSFKDYLTQVKKMSGAGILTILNKCVSFIDEDKCYLEVGVHRGCTLIGASLNNKAMCYGVDNFSGHNHKIDCAPFETIEEGLKDAINRLAKDNVKYFVKDYKDFFKDRVDIEGKKVEVYFYDGDHGKENTYNGVKLALPLLADEAVILLDDSANNDKGNVEWAKNKLLEEYSEISFLKEWIPSKMHGDMWCGLIALKFKR